VLEQLIAESTGKIGKGFIPVDRERLANQRPMATIASLLSAPGFEANKPRMPQSLLSRRPGTRGADHAPNIYILARNSFAGNRTAVAGSIIGINAFNQPDVEASKIETRN